MTQATPPDKPGFILRLRAKPGCFDALVEATTAGDDDIAHWLVCTADDEPDTIWIVEFFEDSETLERHVGREDLQKQHEEAAKLLAEPPLRVPLHPIAGTCTLEIT